MKHIDPIAAYRSHQQNTHGERVEARQRVNGQPNGYKPVSEAELQSGSSEDVMDQDDTISLSDLEAEIDGAGVDPATCVDRFVELNGDRFFVTKL